VHCPILAGGGIHKAINDYRVKHGLEPWEEKSPHKHAGDAHSSLRPAANNIFTGKKFSTKKLKTRENFEK
jgi:hypothetical protein